MDKSLSKRKQYVLPNNCSVATSAHEVEPDVALGRNLSGKLSRGGCLHKRTQKAAQSLAGGCVTIGASVVRLQMRLTGKRNKKGVSVL